MNKENVSKAQIEVWEWKEALYQEVKDMSIGDALDYLVRKGAEVSLRESITSKGKASVPEHNV